MTDVLHDENLAMNDESSTIKHLLTEKIDDEEVPEYVPGSSQVCSYNFKHSSRVRPGLRLCFTNGECILCGRNNCDKGELMLSYGTINLHNLCVVAASGTDQSDQNRLPQLQDFSVSSVIKEFNRGSKLSCQYCKRKGATVGCVETHCKVSFHLPCGRNNGALTVFDGSYPSYCKDHLPLPPEHEDQPFVRSGRKQIVRVGKLAPFTECLLCTESIPMKAQTLKVVRTTCCPLSKFEERNKSQYYCFQCLQKWAINQRTWTRCPFKCERGLDTPDDYENSRFQKQLKAAGVWIPDGELTCEADGNFDDQIKRIKYCYMGGDCLCPKGWDYVEEDKDDKVALKWELLSPCEMCGAARIHRECAGEPWTDMKAFLEDDSDEQEWHCKPCLEPPAVNPQMGSQNANVPQSTPTKPIAIPDTQPELSSEKNSVPECGSDDGVEVIETLQPELTEQSDSLQPEPREQSDSPEPQLDLRLELTPGQVTPARELKSIEETMDHIDFDSFILDQPETTRNNVPEIVDVCPESFQMQLMTEQICNDAVQSFSLTATNKIKGKRGRSKFSNKIREEKSSNAKPESPEQKKQCASPEIKRPRIEFASAASTSSSQKTMLQFFKPKQ